MAEPASLMLVIRIESAVTPRSVWSLFGDLAAWQTSLSVPKSLPPAAAEPLEPEPLEPHETAKTSPTATSASARVRRGTERRRECFDIVGLWVGSGITNLA